MKNRTLSLLLSLLLLAAVMVPGAAEEVNAEHLTVIATTYPLYDMAYQIGGGHLEVRYQPEANAESVRDADLLLCMGGEKDAWTAELEGITVMRAMDGIDPMEGEENVLTVPVNNMIVAAYLSDVLTAADAAHSGLYGNNLGAYMDALIALDMHLREIILPGTKVFCQDGSMAYFAREYGVVIADTADGAVTLKLYEYPDEEERSLSYIELMYRNAEALTIAE